MLGEVKPHVANSYLDPSGLEPWLGGGTPEETPDTIQEGQATWWLQCLEHGGFQLTTFLPKLLARKIYEDSAPRQELDPMEFPPPMRRAVDALGSVWVRFLSVVPGVHWTIGKPHRNDDNISELRLLPALQNSGWEGGGGEGFVPPVCVDGCLVCLFVLSRLVRLGRSQCWVLSRAPGRLGFAIDQIAVKMYASRGALIRVSFPQGSPRVPIAPLELRFPGIPVGLPRDLRAPRETVNTGASGPSRFPSVPG